MIRIGSLFTGIGGFELGLCRTGRYQVRWMVEKDAFARRVLARHWPDVPKHVDVRDFPGVYWHPSSFEVDIITAGWPCTDHSKAGRVDLGRQRGLDGEDSGLFSEVVRVAGLLKPRYLLLENVPTVLVRDMGRVLAALAGLRMDVEWCCLQGTDVGLPQIRKRIFLVAYPHDPGLEGHRVFGQRAGKLAAGPRVQESHRAEPRPPLLRVVDGLSVPNRVDRTRAIGNSVSPQIVEWLGELIADHMEVADAGTTTKAG
jgi:DNA (cytosine-5)-methyltransferase 1